MTDGPRITKLGITPLVYKAILRVNARIIHQYKQHGGLYLSMLSSSSNMLKVLRWSKSPLWHLAMAPLLGRASMEAWFSEPVYGSECIICSTVCAHCTIWTICAIYINVHYTTCTCTLCTTIAKCFPGAHSFIIWNKWKWSRCSVFQ